MVTKKPILLGQYLNQALPRIQTESEPSPRLALESSPPACQACKGQGMLLEVLEEGVLGEKATTYRPIACPNCEKGLEQAKRIWEIRMKNSQLPLRYAQADLSLWGDPRHSSRAGKVHAYLACRAMLSHPDHQVSSHRIASYILNLFGERSPHWVNTMHEEPDESYAGLLLWGDYGVGKTWLAAATLNAINQKGYGLYTRMSQLMQSLRDTWKGEVKTVDLLAHYCEVPVLFIDDMNDSSQDDLPLSTHQQEYAATIMRSRMGDKRPTIITTNWHPDRFARKWGRICADVMMEALYCVEVGGACLRNLKTNPDGKL